MIADTSALIDHLRGVASASAADATTVISVYELLRWRREFQPKMRALLSRLYIYHLDDESAEIAADIDLLLRERGLTVPSADILIAAIAVRNGESVLTSDRDFKRIEEVFGAPKVVLLR